MSTLARQPPARNAARRLEAAGPVLRDWARMLKVGTEAPDFAAETTTGARLALRDLRGRWVVLYFFPKAFTAG
jgi:hypothetical protein